LQLNGCNDPLRAAFHAEQEHTRRVVAFNTWGYMKHSLPNANIKSKNCQMMGSCSGLFVRIA
jgi:hypothetical protein